MSESLDHFVRDALREHDGNESPCAAEDAASPDGMGMGTLPGHRVEAFIARGGMGAVYRARQVALEREVAVKVMTRFADSPELAERFQREALVLGRLEHPNIVPIHELGVDEEGHLFYTMKLVKGRTLQHVINDLRQGDAGVQRQFPLQALLNIFRKVCDAMAFAHSHGIIHRDLKPENIMVGEFGEVLVMDWGLAKMTGETEEGQSSGLHDEGLSKFDASLTMQGSVMGTPQYMSPEQAMGHIDELDERSDIFSLGGILYAILTLRPPVEGNTLEEVLIKVSSAEISSPSALNAGTQSKGRKHKKGAVLDAGAIRPLPHISGGRVPNALSSVVMKALRLEKEERYQKVPELSADIEAYQGGFATTAEKAGTLKQLKLLMLRHKAVTASLLAMLLLSVGFVLRVMASERKATASAALALANEKLATERAEETKRALVESQLAVAQAAWSARDQAAMIASLGSVEEPLRDQRWRYLNDKLGSQITDLEINNTGTITHVIVRPGKHGEFLVADDKGVFVRFNASDRAGRGRIQSELSGKVRCAFSADGMRLAATGSKGDHIPIFRMSDGKLDTKVVFPVDYPSRLAFSPDRTKLLLWHDDPGPDTSLSKVYLLEIATGKELWRLDTHFVDAVFLPGGDSIFYISDRRREYGVVDAATGAVRQSVKEYSTALGLSPSGLEAALATHTGQVVMVQVDGLKEKARSQVHHGRVTEIHWTSNDCLLTIGLTSGNDNPAAAVQLTDAATFQNLGTYFGDQIKNPGWTCAHDPNSGYLIAHPAGSGATPLLMRVPVALQVATFKSVAEMGWSTAFLSDELLLTRETFSVQLQNVSNPQIPKPAEWKGPSGEGYVVVATHPARRLLAVGKRLANPPYLFHVQHQDAASGAINQLYSFTAPWKVACMDFDQSGDSLLVCLAGQGLLRLDLKPDSQPQSLTGKADQAVFAGSGAGFATIRRIGFQTAAANYELAYFPRPDADAAHRISFPFVVDALAASPDRSLIAVGGDDMMVRVYEAETLKELHRFRCHDNRVTALAFHPKLPQLATGSSDRTVKVWDYATADLKHQFVGLPGMVMSIAFNPEGRLLSVEGEGRYASLFQLDQVTTISKPSPQAHARMPNATREDLALAREEKWPELLALLHPLRFSDLADDWLRYGALVAYLRSEEYSSYRRDILQRHASTEDTRVKRVLAKLCLLEPADSLSETEKQVLMRMAEEQKDVESPMPGQNELSYALALLRFGDPAAAEKVIAAQIREIGKNLTAQRAQSYVWVLVCQRLGDAAKLREAQDFARQLEERPRVPGELAAWHDDFIVKVLKREAEKAGAL